VKSAEERTNETQPSLGILNLQAGERKFQLSRHAPAASLQPFIKHYWIIRWDLTGQAPYMQDVVPNPCVNMIVQRTKTAIYGVTKHKYTQVIEGIGIVFGVKFHPGCFYPFVKWPMSRLTERSIGILDVFGITAEELERLLLAPMEDQERVTLADRLILEKLPKPDLSAQLVHQIVERIREDRDITKVEHVCKRFDLHIRKLQRLFHQYIGVSPKWVIKLYRLHNAAETMDRGLNRNLLGLSVDLGYYDQSHFIREFKEIVGQTPEAYANAKQV